MFLVVELCRSQEVVVVPESWTSGGQNSTLWPPYQSAVQLNKAIRSQEAPGEEWISHTIRTIHAEDSYNKARRKMTQVGQQGTGASGSVGVRRSERLKRAASQHSEMQDSQPARKRRRTSLTQASSEATGTPLREPATLPQPLRRSPRVRRPPPQTQPPQQTRRSRRSQPRPSTARSQQERPPPSRRLELALDRLDKCVDVVIALDKQIYCLNVVLCLLDALKKCVMLQEMLDKLVYILDRVMERVQLSDQVSYMEMIPALVVQKIIQFVQRKIIQFVQREAEMESDDEEEDEESSVAREE